MKCPYCKESKKPRGLKNHVRMASGDGHGDAGSVPDSYETDLEDANDVADGEDDEDGPEDGEDAADGGSGEATTVTPSELQAAKNGNEDGSNGNDGDGSDYPFDPSDPDAIELDGGETVDIRKDGEVYPGVEAESGDYLLRTDKGPVLYDSGEDEMYEVLTA